MHSNIASVSHGVVQIAALEQCHTLTHTYRVILLSSREQVSGPVHSNPASHGVVHRAARQEQCQLLIIQIELLTCASIRSSALKSSLTWCSTDGYIGQEMCLSCIGSLVSSREQVSGAVHSNIASHGVLQIAEGGIT